MDLTEQRTILEAFSRTLGKELHNLRERPDILWQQMYNRLQWEGNDALSVVITPELEWRKRPGAQCWFHLKNQPFESEHLILVFIGHRGLIYTCSFSPDGTHIASVAGDGTLRIWDTLTGEELYSLDHANVNTFSFSPDGTRIVSAAGDGTLKIWDVVTGEELIAFQGHDKGINRCMFSFDGRKIISASKDKSIKIWQSITGEKLFSLIGHNAGIECCVTSHDGTRIVSGAGDGTLRIWDLTTGEEISSLIGHDEGISTCIFSPQDTYIASGSSRGIVKLWEAETGEVINTLLCHKREITACSFDPEEKTIVTSSYEQKSILWDVVSGEELLTFRGHRGPIKKCEFLHGRNSVVTASDIVGFGSGGDNTVIIWDTRSGEALSTLYGHAGGITSFAISPGRSQIVSASRDGTIRLWAVTSIKEPDPLPNNRHMGLVTSCTFSPKSEYVASTSFDNTAKVWDIEKGEELFTLSGHKGWVLDCCFSPDGAILITASRDGTIKLWNVRSGEDQFTISSDVGAESCGFSHDGENIITVGQNGELRLWAKYGSAVSASIEFESINDAISCNFSPKGTYILSAHRDGKLRLWNLDTRLLATFESPQNDICKINSYAFSPNEMQMVSVTGYDPPSHDPRRLANISRSDNAIRQWDVAAGELLKCRTFENPVYSCAYSPNEKKIVSGGRNGSLVLWNATNLEEIFTLKGHSDSVIICQYSPEGSYFLSTSSDQNIKIWNVESGSEALSFPVLGSLTCCDINLTGDVVSCGDSGGNLYILEIVGNIASTVAVVTPGSAELGKRSAADDLQPTAIEPEPSFTAEEDPEALLTSGQELYNSGDYESAHDCFTAAIELGYEDPDNAGYMANLCLVNMERYPEAEQGLQDMIDADTNEPMVHYLLGLVERQLGKKEEAIKYFERFLDTASGDRNQLVPEVEGILFELRATQQATCVCGHENPSTNRWCEQCGRALAHSA